MLEDLPQRCRRLQHLWFRYLLQRQGLLEASRGEVPEMC